MQLKVIIHAGHRH